MTFIGESKKTGLTVEFEADSSYEALHWMINHCDMSQEPWEYYEKQKTEQSSGESVTLMGDGSVIKEHLTSEVKQ